MQISFSQKLKSELALIEEKKNCCRRALFYGLLFAAECGADEAVSVSFAQADVSVLFGALARDCIKRETEAAERVEYGRRKWIHTFSAKRVTAFLHALDGQGGASLSELAEFRCAECSRSFLRGVFLAQGTVSDPEKGFHAEIVSASAQRADLLDELLAMEGFPARRVTRGARIGLYYKKNEEIEEFFTAIGAVHAALDLINLKIEKEIRNNENRATNCVAKNIARTVDAVAKQIAAIEKLREHGVLESLSEDLRTTGELRLQHDEASLAELAAAHVPPISKSGLNHRLTRLTEMADKLK